MDTIIEQIEIRKQQLQNTDYIACKIAEGAATKDEYAVELAERQRLRKEIGALEQQLYGTEVQNNENDN